MDTIRFAPAGTHPKDEAAWHDIGTLDSSVELTSAGSETVQAWGQLVTAAMEGFSIALEPLAANFAMLGAWLGALGLKQHRVPKRVRRAGERARKLDAKEARRVYREQQRAGVVR